MIRRSASILAAGALLWGILGASSGAQAAGPVDPVKLNVLFIGAHPDDEAGQIAAFGTWAEHAGLKAGVVTITRGEGGGNAVGPETGPALGILREAEERRAVGKAGIQDIFYLDTVDFYYTVSASLTEQLWGHDRALARIVRILRETRPDIIITMDPAPSPGNHGNHQFAARLAVEGYQASADPSMFPNQIAEGLQPWAVKRIFRPTGGFFAPPFGPNCAAQLTPGPGENVFGVFQGYQSPANGGKTWLQIEFDAFGEYASQGFPSGFQAPSDPASIPCAQFAQIDSRVPFGRNSTAITGIFQGASVPAPAAVPNTDGLPPNTLFWLEPDTFHVVAGQPFHVTAYAKASPAGDLGRASVSLQLPAGWTSSGSGSLGTLTNSHTSSTTFTVTPAANAAPGRFTVGGIVQVGMRATTATAAGPTTASPARLLSGYTNDAVEVVPAVQGTVKRLAQVAEFQTWTADAGVPQLGGIVKPVVSLGSGESRTVRVRVHNWSRVAASGQVSISVPSGFAVTPTSRSYSGLAAGADASVSFTVTNTNTALPTAVEGGTNGDYDATVTTTSGAGSGQETFGLELVPRTAIPHAPSAPVLDGVRSPGEYTGSLLDLSRLWEGDACSSPADCSGNAKVAWYGDALYFSVHVNDVTRSAAVTPSGCIAHWRVDSVEITLDPRGDSENTGTTFKTGIMPWTNDPANGDGPCWERDADNLQGPGAMTAPGMRVAARVSSAPYSGYDLEVKIPLRDIGAAIGPTDPKTVTDPDHLGLDILIYDSDQQNFNGNTRLAWSPFGGVQGDPYRWGHAHLASYVPPAGRPTVMPAPVVPDTAALSIDSPQSILQSAQDGVPLAGAAGAPLSRRLKVVSGPTLTPGAVTVTLRAGDSAGRAHVFAWDGTESVNDTVVTFAAGQTRTVSLALSGAQHDALAAGGMLLFSYSADAGGTQSRALVITP